MLKNLRNIVQGKKRILYMLLSAAVAIMILTVIYVLDLEEKDDVIKKANYELFLKIYEDTDDIHTLRYESYEELKNHKELFDSMSESEKQILVKHYQSIEFVALMLQNLFMPMFLLFIAVLFLLFWAFFPKITYSIFALVMVFTFVDGDILTLIMLPVWLVIIVGLLIFFTQGGSSTSNSSLSVGDFSSSSLSNEENNTYIESGDSYEEESEETVEIVSSQVIDKRFTEYKAKNGQNDTYTIENYNGEYRAIRGSHSNPYYLAQNLNSASEAMAVIQKDT